MAQLGSTKIFGDLQVTGQATVGTITSGVWNGSAIPVVNGGTGATTAAAALTNLGLTATAAELNYTDGVTSAIQTQLDGKEASIGTKNTAFNKSYGTITTDVKMNGTLAVGIVDAIARIDHVHPTDTSREASITSGTTAQYWRGDKSWQAMPTTLPASDVYAWAKEPNKPTYTAAEVGASATGHTHDYVPERVISDWNDSTVINNVTGLISWKNYGNGHVIFDASASTAPNGTSKNNSNPDVAWSSTYPTLMGWNGSSSYGVKVDRARYAESLVTGAVSDGSYYVAKMNVGTADATTSTCPVGFIYGKY